jgi:hypothetical protein
MPIFLRLGESVCVPLESTYVASWAVKGLFENTTTELHENDMSIDFEQVAKVVSPLLTLVGGAIIKHYAEARENVISYHGHVSAFRISAPVDPKKPGEHPESAVAIDDRENDKKLTQVNTHSVILRNAGRRAAKNVRLGHNFLPDHLTVYPNVSHTVEKNNMSSPEIIFPTIVPNEQITISYLYFPPITVNDINTYAKSDDGFVNVVYAIQMPLPSKRIKWATWALAFVGASCALYWLLKLVAYVL